MFKKKDESKFEIINRYLRRRGHELVMSIYLSNYNNHDIYIRFDYIEKLSVYKIVWFDLNFIDLKHLSDYMNQQIVTKYIALKLVEKILVNEKDSDYRINDDIKGDRVEILFYKDKGVREFVFDRFLPLDWSFLIDPLALVFSYLPRSMEVMLNEIFAIFDGAEERYNALKPIKFNLLNGDDDAIFKSNVVLEGTKDFENERVEFLEKIDDHYLAIVEGRIPCLVNIREDDDGYTFMWCNCNHVGYCKHIYATILAIREKQFKPFYKVIYNGKDESLLDKVMSGRFFLCFGIEGDRLLLITSESMIFKADIVVDGKVVFEVIEDDDECSLSKALERYK
ncbi:MAG: hypothetical protein II625_05260 [Bacilli bacterium]|nr:hypothetical protein [Bacilli bacterium]